MMMECPVGETFTLEQLVVFVEKSGIRFANALEREARVARFEVLKNRVQNGDRKLAYSNEYNELFAQVLRDRGNASRSSEYHAEALKDYAKRAWRLAQALQEDEVIPCRCGTSGKDRRYCELCGADEMCEACFYDHRCDPG